MLALLAGCGGQREERTAPDVPPLRGTAAGRFVGVAVRADVLGDAGYATAVGRLFDAVTPENELKWALVHPKPNRYAFAAADRIVDFARARGMRVRGHTLVWHDQTPPWLGDPRLTRARLIAVLRRHIFTVMRHFRGRISEWDVVNEAVADDGGPRRTFWLERIGPSYIALAFRFAHEADPSARLVYNDYGAEGPGLKSDAVYALVSALKRQGVPIDAVGFQTHVSTAPVEGFASNLRRFTRLGLDVELTEVDVRVPDGAEAAARQALAYRRIVGACLAVARCRGIVFWGLDDADSWVPHAYPGYGRAALLDADLRVKPAYTAVRQVLMGG